MFHRIEVRTGADAGLLWVQSMAAGLAAVTLLVAARDPLWTVLSLVALLTLWQVVNRETRRLHPPGRVVLHADGTLQSTKGQRQCNGVLAEPVWVSRWLCVFSWRDGRGKAQRTLAMARRNHPDDFRRLRVFLRLGGGRPD